MFEHDGSRWTFTHNPFSAPIEEHLGWLNEKKNIGEITATQYDVVANGYEIGGGSIRTHKASELTKVLEIIGYTPKQIQADFGGILRALEFGVPPHGGIAWGLERLIMVLQNEPSIREVIAFPKTGDSRDLMRVPPRNYPTRPFEKPDFNTKISNLSVFTLEKLPDFRYNITSL